MDLYARVFMGVEMSVKDALALPGVENYAKSVGIEPDELRAYWRGEGVESDENDDDDEEYPDWAWSDDDDDVAKRSRVLGMHSAGTYVDLCGDDRRGVMVLGVCLADYNVLEGDVPDAVCFTRKELAEAEKCVFDALMLLGLGAKTLASISLYTPVTCSPT